LQKEKKLLTRQRRRGTKDKGFPFLFVLSFVVRVCPPSAVVGWKVAAGYTSRRGFMFASCIAALVQQTTSRFGGRRRFAQRAESEKTANK